MRWLHFKHRSNLKEIWFLFNFIKIIKSAASAASQTSQKCVSTHTGVKSIVDDSRAKLVLRNKKKEKRIKERFETKEIQKWNEQNEKKEKTDEKSHICVNSPKKSFFLLKLFCAGKKVSSLNVYVPVYVWDTETDIETFWEIERENERDSPFQVVWWATLWIKNKA